MVSNYQMRFLILAPIVSGRKGEFSSLLENLKSKGYRQVRIDGLIKELSEDFILIKTNKHNIEAVCDKISLDRKNYKNPKFMERLKERLRDSIEQALSISDGLIIFSEILDKGFELASNPKDFKDHLFSERFSCPADNIQISEIEPRTFSFNSPYGACPRCLGLGKILKVNPEKIFAPELTIKEGGILPFSSMFERDTWYSRLILEVCKEKNINVNLPLKIFSQEQKKILLYGTNFEEYKVEGINRFGHPTHISQAFFGVIKELENRHKETASDFVRFEIERFMNEETCPECLGTRLKKEALGITINNKSINQVTQKSTAECLKWIENLDSAKILSLKEKEISKLIINELKLRLSFLNSVGLEYLTLDRPSATLSGGEAQRIRLASQIGSGLSGVLYVLDEPTIGLHQKDNDKLIRTLKNLRDLGNTVICVEHDREIMKNADYIFDFGPGAGKYGGEVVAEGNLKKICENKKSLTGKYLSGRKDINYKIAKKNILEKQILTINDCHLYNLKNINVSFPLGKFITITGVSGSGKSSLLVETLYPALFNKLHSKFEENPKTYKSLEGVEYVDKVILIDQSPIGKTPRSNPATYTKVFDEIREVYSLTRESRVQGFKKGRFSFNVKGGRCEVCEGQGLKKIEMQFMSDLWITCEVCKGKRYNNATLEIEYRGKNISDILNLTVSEALDFFINHHKIVEKLETLQSVGLGYIHLGQPATTLSGGEAQRVKLASELARKDTGKTIYILDEPTTGLHFADLERLLSVLKILVERGNTVIVIEHNMDVIKNSDWIIDLGPEGGEKGGCIVAEGRVCDVINNKKSYTGQYLRLFK